MAKTVYLRIDYCVNKTHFGIREVLQKLQRKLRGKCRKVAGTFGKVPGRMQESFGKNAGKFREICRKVSGNLQESFRNFAGKFQEFSGDSRKTPATSWHPFRVERHIVIS